MHYGAYGFAIDPTVPTIIVPDGVEIGQRLGFSEVNFFNNLLKYRDSYTLLYSYTFDECYRLICSN